MYIHLGVSQVLGTKTFEKQLFATTIKIKEITLKSQACFLHTLAKYKFCT